MGKPNPRSQINQSPIPRSPILNLPGVQTGRLQLRSSPERSIRVSMNVIFGPHGPIRSGRSDLDPVACDRVKENRRAPAIDQASLRVYRRMIGRDELHLVGVASRQSLDDLLVAARRQAPKGIFDFGFTIFEKRERRQTLNDGDPPLLCGRRRGRPAPGDIDSN